MNLFPHWIHLFLPFKGMDRCIYANVCVGFFRFLPYVGWVTIIMTEKPIIKVRAHGWLLPPNSFVVSHNRMHFHNWKEIWKSTFWPLRRPSLNAWTLDLPSMGPGFKFLHWKPYNVQLVLSSRDRQNLFQNACNGLKSLTYWFLNIFFLFLKRKTTIKVAVPILGCTPIIRFWIPYEISLYTHVRRMYFSAFLEIIVKILLFR